jgi:hypothetical protein
MATPNYKGAGQPSSSGGSWLGSLVGGTPAYKPAPTPTQSPDAVTPAPAEESEGCGPIAIVIPRQVIEQ